MQEKKAFHVNGYLGLIAAIAVAVLGVWLCYRGYADQQHGELAVGVILILLAALCASALTIVQPNEAKVLTFFGNYIGTIRDAGLFMTVPLTDKQSISLRVRNFNSQILKVNDSKGNPVEIAAVVVFKVVDTRLCLMLMTMRNSLRFKASLLCVTLPANIRTTHLMSRIS